MKSVSIEEFKKKRKAKKPKKKSKKAQVEPNLTFGKEEQQVINAVKEASKELGIKTYLVGGAVRDKLLGKENSDMDFMCEDRAEELVAHLAKKYGTSDPVQYDRSQAMMVTLGEQAVDFINAEKLFTPLKKDDSLEGEEEFTTSFDDAYRRDLTINTLMYDIDEDKLVDPTGKGLKDLQEGIINTVIDPFIKFKIHGNDILRALRFAATLGFKLGPKMMDAMKANAERITPRDHGGDISNRRIRRELRKAIDDPQHWAKMRQLLSEAGLDIILAEDVEDVQQDFEGSIQYHWPEKEGSMRIKRFTKLAGIFDMFKKKEESLPALDRWLSKTPLKQTSPKSLSVQPASKDERIQFMSKKLDERLMTIPPEQQEGFVSNFLSQYKMGRGSSEYNAILSVLKNYKPTTLIPGRPEPSDKDIWRD
jgi:tRNA nucleotidyltransferase/poly(A) polymerase